MLSSVTINCQVTKIDMNPDSQFSALESVSQISQVPMIAPSGCSLMYLYLSIFLVMSCLLITLNKSSQVSRIALMRCSQNVFVFVFFFRGIDDLYSISRPSGPFILANSPLNYKRFLNFFFNPHFRVLLPGRRPSEASDEFSSSCFCRFSAHCTLIHPI